MIQVAEKLYLCKAAWYSKFNPYCCTGIQILRESIWKFDFILLNFKKLSGGRKFKILMMQILKISPCNCKTISASILPQRITGFFVAISSLQITGNVLNIQSFKLNISFFTSSKNQIHENEF